MADKIALYHCVMRCENFEKAAQAKGPNITIQFPEKQALASTYIPVEVCAFGSAFFLAKATVYRV